MNRIEAEASAQDWLGAWCARDIERITSHFTEGARFVSPFAAKRTGNGVVVGREALTAYWQATDFGSLPKPAQCAAISGAIIVSWLTSGRNRRECRSCRVVGRATEGGAQPALYGELHEWQRDALAPQAASLASARFRMKIPRCG